MKLFVFLSFFLLSTLASLFLSLFSLFLVLFYKKIVYKNRKKKIDKKMRQKRWDLLQLEEDKNQEILLHFWLRREFLLAQEEHKNLVFFGFVL